MNIGFGLLSPLAGVASFFLVLAPPNTAAAKRTSAATAARPAADASGKCAAGDAAVIWWSPREPQPGDPLRILAISESLRDGELAITGPDAARASTAPAVVRRGGPPWSLGADLDKVGAGSYRVEVRAGGKVVSCRSIRVARSAAPSSRPESKSGAGPVWTAHLAWDRTTENLYSAFVERLFDAPPEQSVDFRPLHQALRDPKRNFLYGHLGLREDDPTNRSAIPATPDCADLPYFLRAYFAWKIGLPFGFRDCDRGTDARPPRCGELFTNEMPVGRRQGSAGAHQELLPPGDQPRSVGQRAHRARRRRDRLLPAEAGSRRRCGRA